MVHFCVEGRNFHFDTLRNFYAKILLVNSKDSPRSRRRKYFPYSLWLDNNFEYVFNTLRPRQNGRHFADDIFKCIILNENVWIPIKISLKFVPDASINNIPASVQIMAWRRSGDKPLSESMVNLATHICVTRLQWVNIFQWRKLYYILIIVCCSSCY